jgi:hypothetical protein
MKISELRIIYDGDIIKPVVEFVRCSECYFYKRGEHLCDYIQDTRDLLEPDHETINGFEKVSDMEKEEILKK